MNAATTADTSLDDEELSADDIAAIDAAIAEDAFPINVEQLEAFCRCIGAQVAPRPSMTTHCSRRYSRSLLNI